MCQEVVGRGGLGQQALPDAAGVGDCQRVRAAGHPQGGGAYCSSSATWQVLHTHTGCREEGRGSVLAAQPVQKMPPQLLHCFLGLVNEAAS